MAGRARRRILILGQGHAARLEANQIRAAVARIGPGTGRRAGFDSAKDNRYLFNR
jgi:hypothetical protein